MNTYSNFSANQPHDSGIRSEDSYELLDVNSYLEAHFNECKNTLNSIVVSGLLTKPPEGKCYMNRNGWAKKPALPTFGQTLTQIEMLNAIKATRDDIYDMSHDVLSRNEVEVCFSDNTMRWKYGCDYGSYYLKNLAVRATFVGDSDSHSVYMSNYYFVEAIAVFGRSILTNKLQGFLLTEHGGKEVIYELEEFVIVSSIDNDPQYASFDEWEKLAEDRLFFTCFNKTRDLLYVHTPKADGGLFDDFDDCEDDGEKFAAAIASFTPCLDNRETTEDKPSEE